MRIEASCCKHRGHTFLGQPVAPTTVKHATGITVGDLLDATIEVQQGHAVCPYPGPRDHDISSGLLRPSVTFVGAVPLRSDDPKLMSEQEAERRLEYSPYGSDDYFNDRTKYPEILLQYIAAKEEAWARNERIPTPQEFNEIVQAAEEAGEPNQYAAEDEAKESELEAEEVEVEDDVVGSKEA